MSTCPMGLTSALAVPRTVPEASSNSWHHKCGGQKQEIGFAIGRLGQYGHARHYRGPSCGPSSPRVPRCIDDDTAPVETRAETRARKRRPSCRKNGNETPSPRCSSRLTTGVAAPPSAETRLVMPPTDRKSTSPFSFHVPCQRPPTSSAMARGAPSSTSTRMSGLPT